MNEGRRPRAAGFLIAGTLLGSFAAFAIVDGWIVSTATDRFWYPAGRAAAWRFVGTLVGTLIGLGLGLIADHYWTRDN